MTEEQVRMYTRSISVFPRVELREAVKVELETLLLDFGQKFDRTEVVHLVDRTTSLLESKYRSFIFNDFCTACEMGKVGHWQSKGVMGMKVTVRLLEQWLWHYDQYRMARASEEQKRQHFATKNQTLINPKSSLYARAVIWKISHKNLFKEKGNWTQCSLKRVVEAFEKDTIHALYDELFK